MPDLNIESKTIDKSLGLLADSTKETRKEIDKTSAKGVNKLAQLFWASPIGIKADLYIAERPYKFEKALEEMKAKYGKIPEENRVEPSSFIALKGVNELNYVLDEEHLKEMFENLLIADMDSRKKESVSPTYINMIQQLNKDDAEFLKSLKNKELIKTLPLARIKLVENNTSKFKYLSPNIICLNNQSYIIVPNMIIENLLRLKIIEIPFDEFLANITDYEDTFNILKKKPEFLFFENLPNQHLEIQKKKLEFTDSGKKFIDICLS